MCSARFHGSPDGPTAPTGEQAKPANSGEIVGVTGRRVRRCLTTRATATQWRGELMTAQPGSANAGMPRNWVRPRAHSAEFALRPRGGARSRRVRNSQRHHGERARSVRSAARPAARPVACAALTRDCRSEARLRDGDGANKLRGHSPPPASVRAAHAARRWGCRARAHAALARALQHVGARAQAA
jgi:hypothetical protein